MQAVPMMSQPAMADAPTARAAVASAANGKDKGFSPLLEQATAEVGQATEEVELAGAAMVAQQAATSGDKIASASVTAGAAAEESLVVAGMSAGAEQGLLQGAAGVGGETVEIQGDDLAAQAVMANGVANPEAAVIGGPSRSDSAQALALGGEQAQAALTPQHGPQQAHSVAQAKASLQGADGEIALAQTDEPVVSQIKQEVSAPTQIKGEVAQVVATELKSQLKGNGVAPVEVVEGLERVDVSAANGKSEISDPRFAALLNKPEVEGALRQRQAPMAEVVEVDAAVATPKVATEPGAGSTGLNAGEKMAEVVSLGDAKGHSAEALLNRPAVDVSQGSQHAATVAHAESAAPAAVRVDETMVTLRNGTMVPEGRIVNQTLEHLSIHARGDSSTVTVKLHPEELGELQLRMVMEGEQLKVHLQAQNQQVQEVLERHFPRLRDALQDQGLTVEDFQVSVDSGSREQQHSSAERESSAGLRDHLSSSLDDELGEQVAQVAPMAAAVGGGGLSVRI